jgi:hypothetical protein
MAILDSMINDIYDRLCDEMAHLLKYAKVRTVLSKK